MTLNFYPNLFAEMRKRRVTVQDIADHMGYSRLTVYQWLTGLTKLRWEDAVEIQEHFFPEAEITELFEEGDAK